MPSQQAIDAAVKLALADNGKLDELIENISPERKKMADRELASKALQQLAEEHPEALYGKWNSFAQFLDSSNAFSKFPSVYILASLTKVDDKKKFEKCFDLYFGLLDDESVAISSHTALNAAKIIGYKPSLEPKITDKLLSIDKTSHTAEHKELVKAYIIEAFEKYYAKSKKQKEIAAFVKEQTSSKSPKAKKLAKQFIAAHNL